MSHKRKRSESIDSNDSMSSLDKHLAEANDDGSEDNEEVVETWDPSASQWSTKDEEYPDVIAYSKDFQEAQQTLNELFSAYPDVSTSARSDDTLGQLQDMCQELARDNRSIPIKIALLGNAGQGKSSVVNSLLDIPDLADTGSNGNSCTNVIFEYTSAPASQHNQYVAYITYHDSAKIAQILHEQISNYRNFEFEFNEDWDEDEKQENEALRDTALDMLNQLFCNQDEIETPESTEEWLELHKSDDVQNLVEIMLAGTTDVLQIGENKHTILVADAGPHLRKLLLPYATASSGSDDAVRRRAIWPLIDVITICHKDARVVQNMVLVDMPGKGDRNRFRDRLSKEYLKQCNGAWVMTDIKRAVDEEAVKRMLTTCYATFSELDAMNIALICTQSDNNIDDNLIMYLQNKGINVDKIKRINKSLASDQKKYNQVVAEVEKLGSLASGQKLKEKEDLRSVIERTSTLKKGLLMKLRNKDVVRKADKAYESIVPDHGQLRVFCVSNQEYRKLKYPDKAGCVKAIDTGIPQLRKFALQLAAPSLEKHFNRRIETAIPNFIDMVDSWCKKQPVANAEQILATVTGPQQQIPAHVKSMFDSRGNNLGATLLHEIDHSKHEMSSVARNIHQHWKPRGGKHKGGAPGWNAQLYASWIRHYGCNASPKQPYYSWNEEWMKGLKDMQPVWQQFNRERVVVAARSLQQQKALLYSIPEALKSIVLPGKAMLFEMIRRELAALDYVYQDENDRQVRFMAGVWADTTREIEGGYFVEALDNAYNYASIQRGTGSTKTMFAIMDQTFTRGADINVYSKVAELIDTTFRTDAEQNTQPLVESVAEIFERVALQTKVMIARKEQEVRENPDLNFARSVLRPWVNEARKQHANIQKAMRNAKRRRVVKEEE